MLGLKSLFKKSCKIAPLCRSVSYVQRERTPPVKKIELSRHEIQNMITKPLTNKLLILSDLRDNPGAKKKKRRVGRGQGSTKGKTCGRGHKGTYKYRTLGRPWFKGGSSPLYKRLPKLGMTNYLFRERLKTIELQRVIQLIQSGRLDPTKVITMKSLFDCRALGGKKIIDGMKLLAKGRFVEDQLKDLPPLHFEMTHTSGRAKEVIEAAGGSVNLVYFTKLTLRAHLKPHKFDIIPRLPKIIKPKRLARYLPYIDLHKKRVEKSWESWPTFGEREHPDTRHGRGIVLKKQKYWDNVELKRPEGWEFLMASVKAKADAEVSTSDSSTNL